MTIIIYDTFVGLELTTVSWVVVLSTDGSTCTVLEVAKVGRRVVDANLVWWGRGEGNDDDGLSDIAGVFLDGCSEDTDSEDDGSSTTDANSGAVEETADNDAKTGAW